MNTTPMLSWTIAETAIESGIRKKDIKPKTKKRRQPPVKNAMGAS
jgi:hypothetical protein